MKLDELRARDVFGQRVKFTQDEVMDLALFVHDKNHAQKKYTSKSPALEKAIKFFSKKSPDLYRGIYKEELKDFEVGSTFVIGAYMSLSEDRKIAENFAHSTKTILHVKNVHAFPYGQWNIEHLQLPLKKRDPEAFENNEGDWMIKELEKEAEWIIGHNTKLKVVSKRKDGEFTIVEVTEA